MSDKLKVVVADPMHEAGIDMLRREFDVEVFSPAQSEARAAAVEQADAVIVRTFEVRAELMDRAPRLAAIVKHGAGVDNIDVAAATERGIVVANSGDANAPSVAEASVCLILAALRHTTRMHRAVVEGRYDIRWGLLLEGISGKTLGVVGFGNIGRRVAAMCRDGFGMKVLAYDPFLSAGQVAEHGAAKAERLEDLLREADVVSLHASLSSQSHYLIGAPEIALMKRSAVLVNTARGGVVDEAALAAALSEGRLFAAGLDVYEHEPPGPDNPLFKLDNVVLSPHIGGATESARQLMATRAAEAALRALHGDAPEFWLNPQVVRRAFHGA
ncbi:hypothetical protein GCM10023144_35610 [Pigmentiphaga soli]|uniref:D-3-phosphoglycerate dehydrogenase n=1 Tax=Pigmentiphaga soli TaxID=1007095 RepID=A0ABP8HFN2_9BURK